MAKQNFESQFDLVELSDADLMAVVGGGIVTDAEKGALAFEKGALYDSPTVFIQKSEKNAIKTEEALLKVAT